MSEMIERAARALCRMVHIKRYGLDDWREGELDSIVEAYWREWIPEVRAVVEELLEPTGPMKEAGARSYGLHTPFLGHLPLSVMDGQPSKAWRAMVNEILRGDEK